MRINRIKAMFCVSTIALALLASLGSSSEITRAMVWSQANVFEQYGPRLDNIHFVFTGTPENSFNALDVGDVDIIDWALSESWKNTWENPARTDIKVMGYGEEYSYYILDTRQSNTKPVNPPWSTQSYVMTGDPTGITMDLSDLGEGAGPFVTTRGASARHALAHLVDRAWIVSTVMGGLGDPIYTPVPAAQGKFVNPNVEKHPQDFAKARAILDRAGFVDSDADTWRDIPGTNTEISLDFFIKIGYPTEQIGIKLADDIEAELNIHVNRQYGGGLDAWLHVMVNREMDLYTGYWTGINWPDHLPWLYGSWGYFPPTPGYAPKNYMAYASMYNPAVQAANLEILTAIEKEEVKEAAWTVQEHLMKKENVYTIPLVSTASPKAWRTYKKGMPETPGNEWKGIVNETGKGVNSWWTFLSAHTDNESNSGTIIYGLSHTGVDYLNPIYASLPQTWEILGKIYDTLLRKNPITLELMPWVASEFIHSREYDGVQGKEVSTLSFTLREDVFWHDGQQLDADDVIFTLKTVLEKLTARGDPPPFWESNVREINRIIKIDNFHIKVYMNLATFFAPIWVGGNIIMPEHIWNPLLHDGGFDIQQFAPDPDLIGSGPYEMDASDYSEGVAADVYAYKPASNGYFQYSPIQTFIVEGEVAEHEPNTNTYWVGVSYTGDVKVATKTYNYDLFNAHTVIVTLFDGPVQIGQQIVNVPANSWVGVRFDFPIVGGIGTIIGPVPFTLEATFDPSPFGETDTGTLYFKVTVDGDVISTGDNPGVTDVNLFDALKVASTWGLRGAYKYPPADINWDGNVALTEALIIVGNFGAAGA